MKIDYNLNGEGAKSVFFVICALVFFAFFEFYYKINAAYPSALPLGYILTVFAGIVFSRVKYEDFSPAFKICFRGLAVLIGLYAAFVFPDYPIVVDKYGGTEGAIVLGGWFLGVLCSLLTLWRPSFLLASGFYLWWSKQIAGTVFARADGTALGSLGQQPVRFRYSLVLYTAPAVSRRLDSIRGNFHAAG